ncbi:histidine phosphatase family protein [Nitratireductor sp. GCM10026969]|uniref:histidine phosphatase family protein n=1 Tax=Nitratireductor sp. GCM10026969 TaxID=3252645 RepID=UPI0036080F0F
MSTLFHLVRHADHGHVGTVLTGRMPGIDLSEAGRAQAGALVRHMREGQIAALFASPQPRARQTAKILSAAIGVEAESAAALDEIDFGRWTGKTFAALEDDPEWRRWNAERDLAATPAGETMRMVAERITGFMEGLAQRLPGATVCLVSHSDVIKAAVCRFDGRPFQSVHAFEISPASVTTLALGPRGGKILALNDCGHLAEEGVP